MLAALGSLVEVSNYLWRAPERLAALAWSRVQARPPSWSRLVHAERTLIRGAMDPAGRDEVDVNFFKFGAGVQGADFLPNATVAALLGQIKQQEETAHPNKRMPECVSGCNPARGLSYALEFVRGRMLMERTPSSRRNRPCHPQGFREGVGVRAAFCRHGGNA